MTKTLQQVAFESRGKVSKVDAARIIGDLAQTYPEAVPQLGRLLAVLQPAAKKAKDAFGWVAQAAAKKDIRKYLNYVMCDGTQAVATCGSRMHIAPCDKEPGLYDPKTGVKLYDLDPSGANHPGKFPDWRRVVPNRTSLSDTATFELERTEWAGAPAVFAAHGGSGMPEKHWAGATERCNRVHFGANDWKDSIYFEGGNGERAVVMPFRMPTPKAR